MEWENTLKRKPPQVIAKEKSAILDSLSAKQKKRLKKTLQAAEPSEYFGQDFTKLGELIDMMKALEFIKSDNKLDKRVKTLEDSNIDIVATATKLRKEYETTYRALRGMIYPQKKGDLRNE
jgi:hypothetical protein|tara:strand:+ start:14574 stop:14936 length:363 start_codon:yes stop_codon:yes gene_type:complete